MSGIQPGWRSTQFFRTTTVFSLIGAMAGDRERLMSSSRITIAGTIQY